MSFAVGRKTLYGVLSSLILSFDVVSAATLPPGFSEVMLASGLRRPTAMAISPETPPFERIFVCEQGGTLRVVKGGMLLPQPFVTLPVDSSGERGLLGVAFDPDFATNQFVYVYYTATGPTHNRVSRFTANGDVAVPGSELVLMDLEPLGASNHNGGAIHFGPDGKLYVAVGENAVRNNAQTLDNRLGKILRINKDGSIPADNPFFDDAVGDNRSIWALGLRNPFTFAFQPLTGTMFINDVGENTWEEINRGSAGANYGWPQTEGPTSDPDFVSPLHAYTHADGCAIAGGAFSAMTSPTFPARYWGSYFFADLCGGWIRARRSDGTIVDLASGIDGPVDLLSPPGAGLYYLARGSGSTTGILSRIVYSVGGPRVNLSINATDGPLVLTDGDPLQLHLFFDDGPSGPVDPAEIYIGVSTPAGVFWLDPQQGFTPVVTAAVVGPVPTFDATLFTIPDAGVLVPGTYVWFVMVDDDADGIPTGDFADFGITIVQ
jgi:glucose/arabinose dehydrogenase